MLAALAKAGVRGKMWRMVDRMYASTRTRITIDGEMSSEYSVESGLREGSVLSPVLYSVFINNLIAELETRVPHTGVVLEPGLRIQALLYADDVVLVAESQQHLQQMLNVAERHADKMQYQFSVPKRNARGQITESGKSQVVIFGENGITPDVFSLHGKELEQKRSYKYLGVHMHQLLGKHHGTGDMCPQDYKGKIFYDKDHDELRCIVDVHTQTRELEGNHATMRRVWESYPTS